MNKWRLVVDPDGQWYIIPALMFKAWYEWLEDEPEAGWKPDFATRVQGPEAITFECWREDF